METQWTCARILQETAFKTYRDKRTSANRDWERNHSKFKEFRRSPYKVRAPETRKQGLPKDSSGSQIRRPPSHDSRLRFPSTSSGWLIYRALSTHHCGMTLLGGPWDLVTHFNWAYSSTYSLPLIWLAPIIRRVISPAIRGY